MLRDQVRGFVTAELQPRARADQIQDNQFPMDMWRKFGEMGLLGITVDEEYGGSALGYLAHPWSWKRDQPGLGLGGALYGAHSTSASTRSSATAARTEGPLPAGLVSSETHRCAGDERTNAGSGVSMKLRADRVGALRSHAARCGSQRSDAHTYVIYAKTDADKGAHGISPVHRRRDWKGFSRGPKLDKLGMRGSEHLRADLP